MKITLIAAAIAAFVAGTGSWFVTRDVYIADIATMEKNSSDAALVAQQTLDSALLFAQTTSQLDLNQIDQTFQAKLNAQSSQHALDIAAVRGGSLRLRDNAAVCAGQSAAVPAGSGVSGSDGTSGADLSDEAAEFLLGEADRADRYANQVNGLEAVVADDRKVIASLLAELMGTK